jgi:polysaccharide chain length determinant protein (PEP-CTERM system associated)
MNSTRSLDTRKELLPLSLLCAFWRQRFWAIGTAVVLSAGAVVVIRKLPSIYKADAVVLVETQQIPERFVASTVTTGVDDRLNTITREVKSGERLREIIRDFDLYHAKSPDALVAKIRSDMEITFDRGWTNARTGGFRVSYKGTDPKVVAAVANRLAKVFIEENSRVREGEAEETSAFIERQLLDAKQKLDQLESQVSQYKLRYNGELPEQENALSGALARLQVSLQGDQDGLNRAEQNKVVLLETIKAAELEEGILARASVRKPASGRAQLPTSSPTVPDPPKRSEVLKSQLASLLQRYNDGHPDVKRVRSELARVLESEELEADEAAKRSPATPATTASTTPSQPANDEPETEFTSLELVRARERVAQLKLQLASLEGEIQSRTADAGRIRSEIRTYEGRIDTLPIREQEFSRLTRDLEISRNDYISLRSKKQSAEMGKEMEMAAKAERFILFEAAQVPTVPVAPNRKLYMVAAAAGSLVFGILLAIGKELKNNVLLGEWELAKETPILGRVPNIPTLPATSEKRGHGLEQMTA